MRLDLKKYGAFIRMKRKELGYRKAEDFIFSLKVNLDYELGIQTLYKIEQGNQAPSVEQFLNINQIIGGCPCSDELLDFCVVDG